jgi:hypothetical protein
VDAFEAAGGAWLAVGPDGFVPFDDSHLDAMTARSLSRELGDALAAKHLVALGP